MKAKNRIIFHILMIFIIPPVEMGIGEIEKVTQNNSAGAQQIASSSEELAAQARSLEELVSGFRLMEKPEETGENISYVPL